MLIKDIFAAKKPVISFEVFPPKKDSPVETIYDTLEGLRGMKPDFISVTYGAGGSTTNRTLEIARLLKGKYEIEPLAHLTCITSDMQEIDNILDELQAGGVKNILALRGDFPQDGDCRSVVSPSFSFAANLIGHIRQRGNFSIGGACYPEGHPECPSLEQDILNLRAKIESGLDFLITQLFFDNEKFYRFMELYEHYNLPKLPVSAGIMPVLNTKQIRHITSLTRATMPKKFLRIMERYEHNSEALKEAGIAYATEQMIDLLAWGIDGIHIYTMNKPEATRSIVNNISEIRNCLFT